MAELMRKMAPMAVVAMVFAGCCWPYVSGSATGTSSQQDSDIAQLSKELLSPVLKPANDRDPFRPVKLALGSLKGNQPGSGGPGRNGPGGKKAAEATHLRQREFALGGTYVQGNRSMAIINGKVYEPGDTLAGSDAARQSWVVKRILPEEVLIQSGEKTTKLTYPDFTAPPEQPDPENNVDPKKSKGDAEKKPQTDKRKKANPITELIQQLQERQDRLQKSQVL